MSEKSCATSDKAKDWQSINWKVAESRVKKLQMRIVKAVKEGKHNKVKSLQWVLTHSFYAKALAVKRVTENDGKKTSGVDRELWSTPKSKFEAISKLKRRGYSPKPLKRVYILKKNGKKRPLGIPTMTDRAMQTLYKFALDPIAETTADPNSYGFRTGRCVQDAIERCFKCLNMAKSAEWILEGDIKGCFDNISHEFILKNIPMDKEILKKFLKCGFIESKRLFPTEAGTPQGGTISPTICNMVLDGLEIELNEKYHRVKINGKMYNPKVNFVRYADDFIVTGATKELLEEGVLPIIKSFMAERGLELSEEKTLITPISKGFDFLGCNIRKYGDKLLTKPSKKNIKAFLDGVRETIKKYPTCKQENLIRLLNSKITGWVNFQKHNVSSKAFQHADHNIWAALWRWAVRRHSNKSNTWIAARYWHTVGNRNWVFGVKSNGSTNNAEPYYYKLVKATDTDIVRWTKIKSEANPFDREWRLYFEERETDKMRISIKGRKILTKLFYKQGGRCPVCGEKITVGTGFKVHDTIAGGKIQKSMVHPACHKSIHSDATEQPTLEMEY